MHLKSQLSALPLNQPNLLFFKRQGRWVDHRGYPLRIELVTSIMSVHTKGEVTVVFREYDDPTVKTDKLRIVFKGEDGSVISVKKIEAETGETVDIEEFQVTLFHECSSMFAVELPVTN